MANTLTAYWWRPAGTPRSLATEAVKHGVAWGHILARGPKNLSNFGDAVNPAVIKELTGRDVRWSHISTADIVCIGSVLNSYIAAESNGWVLGAGLRKPIDAGEKAVIDPSRVIAVRGKWTADQLGLSQSKAKGDPGLVIRNMIPPAPRRAGVTVIPHFSVLQDRAGREAVRVHAASGKVVLPNEDPGTVARVISGSDLVVTSSLHAIVFADAYGVPVQRTTFGGTGHREPAHKYADHDSSLGVVSEMCEEVDVASPAHVSAIIERLSDRTAAVRERIDDVVAGIYAAATPLR